MSLLKTRAIQAGSILAYTGVCPEEGQTFIWGNAKDFDLQKGDVVQVMEINRHDGSPWARVLVAVLKGKCTGRVGQVSINMDARLQRSWQCLTTTGSMAPVRVPSGSKTASSVPPQPAESGVYHKAPDHKTTPSPAVEATFAGDQFGVLSFLPKRTA